MGDEQSSAALTATPATVVAFPTKTTEPKTGNGLVSPFSNETAFVAAQRMANALSKSNLVPAAYQNNLSNCLIAMELASRIGVSVLAAMQNLHVIQGRPAWGAAFLIATVNASGRFTPLRYEWNGKPGSPEWACRAYAKDIATGESLPGSWITWEMAGKEGWTKKSGSKWLTMPEQMFMYRAAAFWCRAYCPEISIGFQTTEEVQDTYTGPANSNGGVLPEALTPAGAKSLEAVLGIQSSANEAVDAETGEVTNGESEPAEKPAAGLPPVTFNGAVSRELAGQIVATASAEQRVKYLQDLSNAIAAVEEKKAKGWEDKAKAMSAHYEDVLNEHQSIAAEAALG